MQGILGFLVYTWHLRGQIVSLTAQHLLMSAEGIAIGTAVAVPAGVFISRRPAVGSLLVDSASMLYTVPSLAMLGFLIPLLGLGWMLAVTALAIYSLLPVLRNTYVGISQVDPAVREAALGMGATRNQLLFKIELPLALPLIMGGLRTVTVLTVGIATLGALVGAGGLGVLIFTGMEDMDFRMLLAGTIPVALLAVILDQILAWIENRLRIRMGGAGG